ncbi:MAG: hypothetical protein ACLQD8_02200 [Thermoplasmata archaeon]
MTDRASSAAEEELYPVLGLASIAVAVGLFVAGTVLLVTCQPEMLISGGGIGCSYPFQGYGLAFLFVSALVTILAFNILMHYRVLRGTESRGNPRRYVVSVIAGIAACAMLVLMALIIGLV